MGNPGHVGSADPVGAEFAATVITSGLQVGHKIGVAAWVKRSVPSTPSCAAGGDQFLSSEIADTGRAAASSGRCNTCTS